MHNTMHMAFNKESMPRKSIPEEANFDYEKWKTDMAEMQSKEKFQKELARFESKKRKNEQLERQRKNGYSKSLPRPEEQDQPVKRKIRDVPLIGDIKKDKLKNSLAMTNEDKAILVARERDMSRNRGICMSEI